MIAVLFIFYKAWIAWIPARVQKFLSCILIVERLQIMLRAQSDCRDDNKIHKISCVYIHRKLNEISKYRNIEYGIVHCIRCSDAIPMNDWCKPICIVLSIFTHAFCVFLTSLSFIVPFLFSFAHSICLSLSLSLVPPSYYVAFGCECNCKNWHVRAIFFLDLLHVAVNSRCSLLLAAHSLFLATTLSQTFNL